MKKIKNSLITIEQVADYLDSFSFSDIWNMLARIMAFIIMVIINILLFPIVLFRILKLHKWELNQDD